MGQIIMLFLTLLASGGSSWHYV